MDLSKLMNKKSGPEMSDSEVQAKMDVVMELLQMAQEAMAGKAKSGMDEMHKVSVMAPDAEGMKAGLEMAEDVAEEVPEMELSEQPEETEEVPSMPKKKRLFSMNDDDEDEA